MANHITPTGRGGSRIVTLDTTGALNIGNVHDRYGGSFILHVKAGGASPGSFVPKTRVTGSGYSSSEYQAPVYWNYNSDTLVTAGTAISAEGVYGIPCDGQELILDYTSDVDGMEVIAIPSIGV
jgi:hypothetical protein